MFFEPKTVDTRESSAHALEMAIEKNSKIIISKIVMIGIEVEIAVGMTIIVIIVKKNK